METAPLLYHGEAETKSLLTPFQEFGKESKLLWNIAGPAIFTAICQYSLGAITLTFAGLIGEIELAAVSVENSVIAGLSFGVMLGMGSALETLCGQAFGAGQIRMLGVYMQRSWLILLATACLLTPIYIWSPPILVLFGETTEISKAAGFWSQLFAYAVNFPIQKFLQSQRKVWVMAVVSAIVLVLHTLLSWLFMLKFGWGLVGAAVMLNTSWWLIVIGQLLYIFITTSDGAWSGFSWLAFSDLWGFVKLSLASAVMLCVRVSNELGAGNFRQAKISVFVVSGTSIAIGVVCFAAVLATRDWFPYLFTTSEAVAELTSQLAILLAFTVLLNSLQQIMQASEAESRVRRWGGESAVADA